MRFGVDANFFKDFIDSKIHDLNNDNQKAMDYIVEQGKILSDLRDYIISEWRSCTGADANEYVDAWISDMAAQDVIIYAETNGCPQCRKLVVRQGMPTRDAKTLSIFKDMSATHALSHDIDFYEPAEKSTATPARRNKLMNERRGSICRLIERQYGIIICCSSFIVEEFCTN